MKLGEIQLSEIDTHQLDLIVERMVIKNGVDHSRWVFKSRKGDTPQLVYKIWNPEYVRRDNILTGLKTGLYSDATVPGLRALIMEKGQCRGYVMGLGRRYRAPATDLIYSLWEATRQSRCFTGQYRRSHTLMIQDRVSLIDLEAVHAIGGDPHWTHGTIEIEDPDYAALVARLEVEDLTAEEVREMADCHIRRISTRLSPLEWTSRRAIGVLRRLRRKKMQTLGDRRDAIIRDR